MLRRTCTILICGIFLTTSCKESPARGRAAPAGSEMIGRLDSAMTRLADVEARIEKQKEEARFFECKSTVERVRSEIFAEEARCLQQIAAQAECQATEERKKGDATLLGCIVGLGLAAYSGGTAMPYALSGCAFGRGAGELGSRECPVPECVVGLSEIRTRHFDAEGWSDWPQCGGWIGVQVETPLLTLEGGLEVVLPEGLEAAGIKQGDFVAYADDQRVRTIEMLRPVVASHAGQSLTFKYVRENQMYAGTVQVPGSGHLSNARFSESPLAAHRWGARIVGVDPASPLAQSAPLSFAVFSLDGVQVASREHLAEFLRYRRAGEEVSLVLTYQEQQRKTVKVTLGPRVERVGL